MGAELVVGVRTIPLPQIRPHLVRHPPLHPPPPPLQQHHHHAVIFIAPELVLTTVNLSAKS